MENGRHSRLKWDDADGGDGLTFDISGDFCKEFHFTLTVPPLLFLHLMNAHINFLFQLKLFRQLQLRLKS